MSKFYLKLGEKIKDLRVSKGLSQDKVAEFLGINRVSFSQVENGERKITAEEISRLSELFNIPSDVLLDLKADISVALAKKPRLESKEEVRINVPQKKIDKFKEVLLYILTKVGSKPNVGETVIYKLFYFIDFDFYEKYEEQLIGATYIKNHYGPTPAEFKEIIKSMKEDKDLIEVKDQYFLYPQIKYLPLRSPDLTKLKGNEIQIIEDVLNKLSNMNANEISEYSHNDVPWLTTEKGKVIDYEKVFYRTKPYSVRNYSDGDF
jgi:transcriptional regulator with XRE-family HTH domain